MELLYKQELLIGDNGYLNRRLTYIKQRDKKNAGTQNTSIFGSTEMDTSHDLQFLKDTALDKTSDETLTQALNSTRPLRDQLMENTNTNIRRPPLNAVQKSVFNVFVYMQITLFGGFCI